MISHRTQAGTARGACPVWCDDHIGGLTSGLHQHTLAIAAGGISVVLEQQDGPSGPGLPCLSFRSSAIDEVADDVIDLPLTTIFAALSGKANATLT